VHLDRRRGERSGVSSKFKPPASTSEPGLKNPNFIPKRKKETQGTEGISGC